ncbi:MAG TPA: hypothetical protein VH183_09340 [Burkholderiaceae bacterium]|jgi:hypothetical protein|nr:hypothetical protein [Burkholderiaceae bacterium]
MNTRQKEVMQAPSRLAARSPRRNAPIAKKALLAAAAFAGLAASACAPVALAATPLISLIGPDEWHLPIVESKNLFLQSGLDQINSSFYDANGNSHDHLPIASFRTYAGVTRFAHLFSFESLPGVGFGVEYLQPYLSVQLPGQSITGLADPLFEIGAYYKPAPNLTLGYINVPSVPLGSNELSKHFWSDTSLFIGNYHIGKFGFNGTLAYGVASTQHQAGQDTDIGDTYGAEMTALYEVTDWVAPFVGFVYHKNEASHASNTGVEAPGQGPLYSCFGPGGCHESLLGGGFNFHFTRTKSLGVWYYTGVGGSNVIKTNAAYLFYTQPF